MDGTDAPGSGAGGIEAGPHGPDRAGGGRIDPLNLVGIEVIGGPDARVIPRAPGLPDHYFEHDNQITSSEIRAVTLAALAPRAGEMLWDIGCGSGSIAIEWALAHPANRAIGIEAREDRAERARRNCVALGVPSVVIVSARAPEALKTLGAPEALSGLATPGALSELAAPGALSGPTAPGVPAGPGPLGGHAGPDAVFIGGGAHEPGVLDAAWAALRPGGRIVVNAVSVETEALLFAAQAERGGTLTRLSVDRLEGLGRMRGFRRGMTITQWIATRP